MAKFRRKQIFELELLGDREAIEDLDGISRRMNNLRPVWTEVEGKVLEGERRVFKRLRGRYQDTGAVMRSLTLPSADGAIRFRHHDALVFGTSIYYAKYLRGKTGKSAVLLLQPKTKRETGVVLMDYIMGRHGVPA